MRYKNKTVAGLYRLQHNFLIAGIIMALIGALLVGYGFFAADRVRKNVHSYEEVLTLKGNHAGRAATFEVTEISGRVGGYSHGDYYLVTDGNRVIISEMKEKGYEEIKRELSAHGVYHLKGLTLFVSDKDCRKEIARGASLYFGKKIDPDDLETYLGEVQLKNTGHDYLSVLWSGYCVNLIFGGVLFAVGVIMTRIFAKAVKASCKIESLSGVTFADVNRSTSEGTYRFYDCQVCLTDDLVVGFRADTSLGIGSQIAFKYSELRRIYTVKKKKEYADPSGTLGHYLINVIAEDGKEYVLTHVLQRSWNSTDIVRSGDAVIRDLKLRAPELEYGPANIRYRVYRFPFSVPDPENPDTYFEGSDAYEKVKSYLEDLSDLFAQDQLENYFTCPEAIYRMELSFTPDGFAEIKVGYPEDQVEKVEPTMEAFLWGQLTDGWGENLEAGDYSVVFRADV